MTRTMYDSTNPGAIPLTAQIVAGYLSPSPWVWSQADWDRFPSSTQVRIAVRASTNDGHVLDVEQGDATPTQAPGWVQMRRAAGADPTVYCSASQWSTVKAAFAVAGVAEPHWWIAHYDGATEIPEGAVAKQFAGTATSGGDWDLSVVADYWPGVDQGVEIMTTSDPSYQDLIWRVSDLVHANQVQSDGQSKGDTLTMVTVLLDSAFRTQAMLNMDPQSAGPSGGTNQLAAAITALSTKVDALSTSLSADETALLAAIKAQPTGGQVDVHALAAALAPLLPAELSKADAQAAALAAVEQVFSKGATA